MSLPREIIYAFDHSFSLELVLKTSSFFTGWKKKRFGYK